MINCRYTLKLLAAALTLAGRAGAQASACDMAAATPWITRWFDAWQLTADKVLHLPKTAPPAFLFFDTKCVYTTSDVGYTTAPVAGPSFGGVKLTWHVALYHDSVTLPNSSRMPVSLTAFANVDKKTGRPFFVMAAPDYWASKNVPVDKGLTGVFIHEFAHTRQINGFGPIIGSLDASWKFPEELGDDVIQAHFKSDSSYVAAFTAERDVLNRAATADSVADVRRLAAEALAMARARQARWFVGDEAVFSVVDETFLSMEGAAQWAAASWLALPEGGGMTKDAAVAKMLGRRRFWTQDEGLELFLVVDRLMPDWPSLVFSGSSIGAYTLLERALQR